MNTSTPNTHKTTTTGRNWFDQPRNLWLLGAGLLLAGAGMATALVLREPADPVLEMSTAAVTTGKSAKSVPKLAAAPRAAATVCASCGVVEAVNAVTKKGQGTGAGAVVGGVLGGVAGNQMGGGSGKTAMTVIGVIGGGLAGNEVEKRARSQTVYDVRVRMDDGTLRTLTLDNAPVARGDRVSVDGQQLRRIDSSTGSRALT
jgi:outer membrane lipoprotein SlyB